MVHEEEIGKAYLLFHKSRGAFGKPNYGLLWACNKSIGLKVLITKLNCYGVMERLAIFYFGVLETLMETS